MHIFQVQRNSVNRRESWLRKWDIFPNNVLIGLDKTEKTCYNTSMRNKKTLTKENKMTFTKYNTNVNHVTTHEMVASRIEKGLTNELRIVCQIGTILRDMGKNNTQINFLMNVDNDFITDVLSAYKG